MILCLILCLNPSCYLIIIPTKSFIANVDTKVAHDLPKALDEVMVNSVSPFTSDKMNDVYGVYDW